MNQLNPADMEQLIRLIDFLLISVGLSALILGVFIGWYFCSTRPTYCQDCMWPGSEPVKDSDNEDK